MTHSVKSRLLVVFLFVLLLLAALPAAADVTVSGTVNFSSLDGSAQDDDHTVNGVFTVNGNLTIQGSINCNDSGPSSASACSMKFVVSGDVTMLPGSAVFAENRTGSGNGGNIIIQAGGNVTAQSPSGILLGAKISSARTSSGGSNDHAGDITISAGGTTDLQAGSHVSAAANNRNAGTITVNGAGVITVAGIVSAGGSDTVNNATKLTGAIFSGSASNGGTIRITSSTHTQPALIVTADAVIASEGGDTTGTVTLEGCDVRVLGLVASISDDGTGARVVVRSGTTILVDGRDVNRPSATLGRFGVIRADSSSKKPDGSMRADLFAANDISVFGPDPALSSVFSVNANPDTNANKDVAGSIRVISTAGAVTASGNAFSATTDNAHKGEGGSITIASRNNALLNSATLKASGQDAGGHIQVRSHSGSLTWQLGVGDVRPVGSSSGVSAALQGTIALTYCTTISTSGTSFPTNGPPVGVFPTIAQSCSPAAPSLPAGEPVLPTCNRPPVAANDNYTVAEGGTLNVPAPGVLTNDSDPDGDPITAVLVSGPAHASSFALNANGSFTYVHDGSETTSDSFTYRASDGSATSNLATVSINVTPVNDVPVANNDNATVAEGGTINMAAPGVLANDTDPDGPSALTAILVSGPAHASSFTLNPNGSYIYIHDGSETTSDTFTYKASDSVATSNTATVSITITPVNDAPVANNDTYSVAEGGTLNQSAPGVLGNDTDSDSPTLTAVLVSGPAHASSFALNANGSFSYVHDGSETTSDSFTYRANDGSLNSNVATVSITITPVNDAPVANNDAYSVAEGGTLNIATPGVLANDTDVDSPTLTAVLVSGPAHASSFALNANGSFTYVHDGSETLTDSFTYRANDGSLNSNVATVSITITPVNDAPVANNDAYSVAEGGTLNTPAPGVLGNDTDPDSPTLTSALVSGPAHASSFTLNPNGSFTYVHDGSETTTDSFTYRANDGSLNSNIATVTITISPVNDAPVANNDAYAVNEGGTLNQAAPGVLGNDTDSDSPTLTAVLVSGPSHAASFALNADGSFTYIHDGSETTSDVFTYKANDGSADSNVATVTITVNPVNDAPVANNDTATVAEGGTINQSAPGVLANDTDSDSPTLTAVLVSGPAHASSFTLNPDGSYVYVHDGSETTSDSFTYQASDGVATSNTATVSITITPVNDAPVANNDSYSVAEGGTLNQPAPGVLGNDTDSDSPTLTAVLVSGPAHASSFTLNPNGSFTYVHDGSETLTDSFTYRANDGSLNSNVATVNITITPVNDAPVAFNDGPYNVPEGGTLHIASPGVLANDTDVDSPTLTAVLVSGPAHASSFTLNANGSFTYVHDGSETLTDSFTYMANDGSLNSNVATVTITITPVNDAPTAVNDSYAVAEGGTLNTPAPGVLGNDTDPDSPTLTAALVSGPAHASSFSLNADGSFTYVHDGSETTTDSFTYRANDGLANSNVATVTITISPVNDAPVANNDAYAVNEGGTINAVAPGVLGNDTDADSPTLTAVLVSGPTHAASFSLNADGSFTYVHDGSETTSDVFTYRANDGSLNSNIATVTITVTPVNDAPVVTAGGTLTFTEGDPATVIDNSITITDSDSANLVGATVKISGNYASGQDVLGFTNTANITGSFNTGTGTLTLTGSDTVANYQAALRSVTYNNTSGTPSTLQRTVTWQVDDGAGVNNLSAPVTSTINVVSTNDAPILANGSTITYTENNPATVINSVITVTDSDSPNLTGATVQITSGYNSAQDVLSFTPFGGISGSFNSGTGTLTLSGSSSVANYQTALRNVKYTNTSEDPTTASRTVVFQVTDGSDASNTINSTINITAVNDPPTATAFSGLSAQAGIPITYPAGKLSGTDVEAGTTVIVDTTPINLVNASVTLNANGSFTFTPTPQSAGGTASFQYRVTDNGNPAPGANSAYVTVSFNVAGPAIYFVKAGGTGNCTLGNECTLTTALAFGAASANIFISDAATHTNGPITLNSGGTIIGQGIVAPSFDALYGIVAPAQGTLAPRPAVNQARPTISNSPITLGTNSTAAGFNMSNNSGDTLIASSKSGLLVKDMDITSTAGSGTSAVHFTNSSGIFAFGPITALAGGSGVNFAGTTSATTITFGNVTTASGDAVTIASSGATNFSFSDVTSTAGAAVSVNTASGALTFHAISANGAPTGILVQNATGSFTVNGTGTTSGTGGTVQNCSAKGADFRSSNNIVLKNMTFTNNATTNGPSANCADIVSSVTNNGPGNCNANISLLSDTAVTLNNVRATGSQQIGIDGQSVNGLTMTGVTVTGNGNEIGEDGVQLANVTGNLTVDGNSLFRDNAANQFEVGMSVGTLNATVTNSTFSITNFPTTCLGVAPSPGNCTANSGLSFRANSASAATMNATVTNSTFQNIYSFGLRWDAGTGISTGTVKFGQAGAGNTFTNNGLGANVSTTTSSAVTYEIRDNTLTNNTAVTSTLATTAFSASLGGSGSRTGTIDNNTVGTNAIGATASGCFVGGCDAIQVTDSGLTSGSLHSLTITNNRIYHVNGAAIRIVSSGGSAETLRARVQNNVANFPDNPSSATAGILVQDGNSSPNGVFLTCLDINGNQIQGLWAAGSSHKSAIRLQASRAQQWSLTNFNTGTEYLPGAVTPGCTAQCTNTVGLDGNAADFLSQQNPLTIAAQTVSGGSSASQTRVGASAPWTGTAGVCP